MSADTLARLIRRHPFCEGMTEEQLDLLAGCAKNVKFAPGERIFRNGEIADTTYLIRAGRVSLVLHGEPLYERAGEGDLLGWAWLFPPYRWSFDAVALTPVRALQLDGTCLRKKCEDDPRFGFELVRRILYRAQRSLERSRLQSMDIYKGTT